MGASAHSRKDWVQRMIQNITVTNHLNQSLVIDLYRPESSGFIFLGGEGLTPGKATINTTPLVSGDGSLHNSSNVNSKNILLYLRFMENPTIQETRRNSYKYFPIGKEVKLTIETDIDTLEISGKVESNEPVIFSKSEGTSISILTEDAYFSSLPIAAPFTGNTRIIEYLGNVSTGFEIVVDFAQPNSEFGIHPTGIMVPLKIDSATVAEMLGTGLTTGDTVRISTVFGKKKARLYRNNLSYDVLNAVMIFGSVPWLELQNGENSFTYFDSPVGSVSNVTINYTNLYQGV